MIIDYDISNSTLSFFCLFFFFRKLIYYFQNCKCKNNFIFKRKMISLIDIEMNDIERIRFYPK